MLTQKYLKPVKPLFLSISHRKHHIVSGMSQYQSIYPTGEFDPAYKHFFEQFYKISDTPDAHELYSKQFTQDATLVMASKTVKGRDGT